ncbi:oxygenase MpaB family protein [Myroides sp. JBRI-B21084]|uniref:oxygenase MpaB family protein n=1 Tax=Myroides sp. JBRI-B21084 TaxID=3119977 RepID=UPI0026E29C15|nr:oxygenase MpaB family protein [Paenimyroides cloacae]WKW46244.1 oxygenase MpaB family protein [Paenimyroides cloacae]
MKIPERYQPKNNKSFASYWQPTKDNLLPFLLPKTNISDSEKLVPYYFKVDDLADEVAVEYFTNTPFNQAIAKLHTDFSLFPSNKNRLSLATQNLFQQLNEVPSWVDFDLVNLGTSYCNRTGTAALSVLRNYCLMGGYESSAINKPLIFTQALHKGAVKRLADTVDFWMYVTEINGLKPNNKGIYAVLTTRLIHAYSRIQIEKKSEWKSELWGRPINLWDMLATNLGFSIAFIDGLSKLKFKPTAKELEAVLHLWKYVGYLMGIPLHLLPNTGEEAAKQLFLWSKSQKGIDTDSKQLAWALYDEPLRVTFTKNKIMKWFVQKTNLGYNEVLLGTESRQELALPYSKAKYWILFLNKINEYFDTKAKSNPDYYNKIAKQGRKAQEKVWKLYQQAK